MKKVESCEIITITRNTKANRTALAKEVDRKSTDLIKQPRIKLSDLDEDLLCDAL